ncbi:CotO family spore coat protein [Bacillus sp. J33]|uniref:CotO family spore coat protein n=1 Tax=Bacillus sp. J33 TaxID=935836 RepID=UPI00047B1243|nr:CotO family spore coat protein [Bacillus sp. J33]
MAGEKEKEPLFYIQQPKFQFPETRMQTVYSSRKAELDRKKKLLENSPELDATIEKNKKKAEESADVNVAEQEKVQETIEEFEASREEKKEAAPFAFTTGKRKPSFQRVKSFKEMNTAERIDYLIDFPKQLPPIPCIFETDEKAKRGFLLSKDEERIQVKLFDESVEQIRIQSIKEIKMIGLRG